VAPYFVEEVRSLSSATARKRESGLSVKTTLDATLQEAANRAVERGLRQLDKRRGYRRPKRNVLAEGRTIDNFKDERWTRRMAVGDVVPAVVVFSIAVGIALITSPARM
jgi:penicillin-binding protein 1A